MCRIRSLGSLAERRKGAHVGVFMALVPQGAQAPGLVVALDGARGFGVALVARPQLQQRLVAALQGRQLLLRRRQLLAAAAQAGFRVLPGPPACSITPNSLYHPSKQRPRRPTHNSHPVL